MTPTPTPRTDAAIEHILNENGHVIFRIHPKVCARLEVELAAERALADRLAETIQSLPAHVKANINPQALTSWKEARGA